MAKQLAVVVCAMAMLVACGGGRTPAPVDSGTGGNDAGMISTVDSGPRADAGSRPDTGMTSSDPCAATDMPLASLGCNGGYASGTPTANGWLGTCTPDADPMANPAGSCTDTNAICGAADGETMGTCLVACPPAATYVSTGGCPTGSRCFTLGTAPDEVGICFRDCDAAHACPAGYMCDEEGSCVTVAP